MGVTLKDIAAELGLSVNTVSKALRDMPDIGAKTKQSVNACAEHMGYRKNLAASRLRTNCSYILGVLVTDFVNPAMSKIISGAESAGKQAGYTIMVGATNEDAADEEQTVNGMLGQGVDGILLIPSLLNEGILDKIKAEKVPFVLAVRKYEGRMDNAVYCDDLYGAGLAADAFYACGHRRFLYLSGRPHISSSQERLSGLSERLLQHGIPASEVQTLACDGGRNDAYDKINRWLSQLGFPKPLPVTAIFAFSDYVACGVYAALKEHGYRIPEDVSVIGYDNNEFSTVLEPSLTTVDNFFYEIGLQSAVRLIELINAQRKDMTSEPSEIVLRPELVWRNSVRSI